MEIPTTDQTLEWLYLRLREARGCVEAEVGGHRELVFVLTTRTKEERCQAENLIYAYFREKLGGPIMEMPNKGFDFNASGKAVSIFTLPGIGRVALIDIGE